MKNTMVINGNEYVVMTPKEFMETLITNKSDRNKTGRTERFK
jgi:hypothetical protein